MVRMSTTTAGTAIPVWTVGDRLVKAREWVEMTQQEMADALSVGRRSITRYEQADDPPRAIILAYSAVTGVAPWWILGEEPTDPSDIAGYTGGIWVIEGPLRPRVAA
jgi:transcriptional regulator with XRE-family HTH domain